MYDMMKPHITIYSEFGQSSHLHSFLNATICMRKAQLLECLDNYSRNIGNAVNEYLYCYFAQELDPDDLEYFGNSGVAVYDLDACANRMYVTVMTKKQFFNIFSQVLYSHRHQFSKNEWTIIQNKLNLLLY